MKKYLNLLRLFIKQSIYCFLIYRSTAIITILFTLMFFGIEVIFGFIIFEYKSQIAGLSFYQYINLICSANLITSVYQLLFAEAHENLSNNIIEGELDYILIRPINSYFYYVFNRLDIPSIINFAITLSAIIYNNYESNINILNIFLYCFFILISVWTVFLINQLVVCTAFWKGKTSKIIGLPETIFDVASRPMVVYPKILRLFLTYIIPLGITTNDTSWILTNSISLNNLLYLLIWNILITVLSIIIWKKGLTHYASAN